MKFIGITQRVAVDPRHGERRDVLDQRWPQYLSAVGVAALPLPNAPALAVHIAAAAHVVGIILSGGDDLVEYGGQAPERDATERALLDYAHAHHLPLLGVCRGMQALQHLHGTRLEAHTGHVATTHRVTLEDGSTREVNSYHNLLAKTDTQGFVTWARSADHAVEAIRHTDKPLVGIMWHPERTTPFAAEDLAFFRSFFKL